MVLDQSFSNGPKSPKILSPPRQSSPPYSPLHNNNENNNANNFDDIFGSAPSSPSLIPSASAARGTAEPSDIPRLRSVHSTAGYRDGLTTSKGTTIQEGFDEGFGLGAAMGLRVGIILGTLEGIWSAVAKAEMGATIPAKNVTIETQEIIDTVDKAQSEAQRLRALVTKARESLQTESVFGTKYWGADGTWKYDVKETDGGWNDVVDGHPLIQAWEAIMKTEVDRVKLDTGVLEGADVRRLDGAE